VYCPFIIRLTEESLSDIEIRYLIAISQLEYIMKRPMRGSVRPRDVAGVPSMLQPDRLVRQFFLGFIRIHILHHAAMEPVTGVNLSEELKRHGYKLSPGTLYPILHALTVAGYLRCTRTLQAGRVQKPYVITRVGRRALARARKQIVELVMEVLEPRNGQVDT
jgi:PadR family transcriptional regulator